ncbi:PAS domain S-box protein [Methanoregula sp.]|uniref:PAS domain S-box protein n=2 Tax=Methanoregula sp. TaxID=2052170 RepID=UPI003BAF7010
MYSILYVDDDQNLLAVNKILLEKTGAFSVTTLPSAKESLDRISSERFDAILSDYQMPEMDGIAFLKCVRARHGSLPFILFTGKGREEIAIEALNNGADFYIQKGPDMKGMLAELKHKLCHAIERRQTETALRESRQNQNDIINFLPDATFVIDTSGKIVAWNKAIEEMTGTSGADMIGKGDYQYALPFFGERRPLLIDFVHEEQLPTGSDYLYIERRGRNLHAEVIARRLDGCEGAYLWLTAGPLYDLEGHLTGAIESIRDMSEILKIRHDLARSREMNQEFANMMPVAVYEMDLSGNLTFTNSVALEWFGVTREDFEKKICIYDYIVPHDRERAARDIHRVLGGVKSVGQEYLLQRKDRSTYLGLIYASGIMDPESGKCLGLRGVIIDMTERKKIAQALHESEERLALAVKAGDIGTWDINLPCPRIVGLEDWYSRMLGYDTGSASLTLESGSSLLHKDDLSLVHAAFREHVNRKTPLFETEARVLCRDKTWKWVLVRGKVIEWDAGGNPARITGTVNDITGVRNARNFL